MKLHQLRYAWEVAQHGLNVTRAASDLYTSQPGISKQIRLLEDELGVEIFDRQGRQLSAVTDVGEIVLEKAGRILREVESIRSVAEECRHKARGTLSIAATHLHARYVLPTALATLREAYPEVKLELRQGSAEQVSRWATSGVADFALASDLAPSADLAMLPSYRWRHCVVVPREHPLAPCESLVFDDIAAQPLVAYDAGGRQRLPWADRPADGDGDAPQVALWTTDAEAVKTYVRLGFGLGVLPALAYDPQADADLARLDATQLFGPETVAVGCRQGLFLRQFMIDFLSGVAPQLTPEAIDEALAAPNPAARHALFRDIELPER